MKKRHTIPLLLTLVCLFFTACEEEHFSTVPDVSFRSYPIFLDDPAYLKFAISTSIKLDQSYGGYAGLIIYRAAAKVYYAYDLCCPLHVDEKEALEIDGSLAFCPTDSVYYPLLNGDPAIEIDNAINPTILKSYKVSLNGNTLIVYN